jgi:hypothetical protein
MTKDRTNLAPPRQEPEPAGGRGSREPLWWLLAMLGAAALARVAMQWKIPLPACHFKQFTGAPCPFCGGTRTLRSAAELDLWAAFQFNPLIFLAGVAVLGWFALWLIDRFRTAKLQPRIQSWFQRWPVWWIAGGLVLANWVYLIQTLP